MDRETRQAIIDTDNLADEIEELIERAQRWRETKNNDGLIFKNFEGAQPHLPSPQQTLDDASSRGWNNWLWDAIEVERSEMLGGISDVLASERSEMRAFAKRQSAEALDEIRSRLDDIEQRLSALEDENNGYQG